ncbi:Bacterial type II secretion system protein F domain protein [Rosistilla carotiformis]|uniref:Bacterial type II secretion system protein F domain protein n=1 Tax=Rosistilla carotiformis TaxID=2528017 RepID=A0A518JLU6_9BACT|nr:type II secretion system F family protein [Rosistilla carotiformis]QDV66467.1 Bacterial type II secretion system protein F domain protein [Rosistilla carotiformis]
MSLLLGSMCVFAAVFLVCQSLGPVWDRITDRYLADIKPKLARLSVSDEQLHTWMRWWGITFVATIVLFTFILGMPPIALFAAFIVFIAPRYMIDLWIQRHRIVLRDQLVRATVGVANGCRAGLGLPQAIEKVAFDTQAPLANELKRITRDYRAGRPLQDAIREVKERLDLDAFTTFASAMTVTLEKGGNVAMALDRISQGLQESQRLERKLEADTAAGRKMALILSLFPIGFLGLFYMLDPISMAVLFGTLMGQLVLLVVLVIVYVSWEWCLRILDIDF